MDMVRAKARVARKLREVHLKEETPPASETFWDMVADMNDRDRMKKWKDKGKKKKK